MGSTSYVAALRWDALIDAFCAWEALVMSRHPRWDALIDAFLEKALQKLHNDSCAWEAPQSICRLSHAFSTLSLYTCFICETVIGKKELYKAENYIQNHYSNKAGQVASK